jgi:hypothetical protein
MAASSRTSADAKDPTSSATTIESMVSAVATLAVDETPDAEKPFRYLDLPFEVRYRILNEHLLQPVHGTMLPKEYAVHYQAIPVPAALLQVNKFVHDEAKAELALLTKEKGISLVCALNNILLIARILEMVTQEFE